MTPKQTTQTIEKRIVKAMRQRDKNVKKTAPGHQWVINAVKIAGRVRRASTRAKTKLHINRLEKKHHLSIVNLKTYK